MSQTLQQIFVENPIITNTSTDLIYFSQSPYTAGNDAAMTYANFEAQFAPAGSVASGTINQLAWYSATGAVVSGLATANDGTLITSAGGVPSISSTLPSAVQNNITALGVIGEDVETTGSLTTAGGVKAGVGSINQQTAVVSGADSFQITKSFSGSSATTFLQLTIPAEACFCIIECFLTVSRGAGSDKGTSLIKKAYFSIARNGSGTNVVLDGNLLTTAEATTTTSGGSLSVAAATGAMTIVRDGVEANTAPQVVNVTVNPVLTASNTGRAVVLSSIVYQGNAATLIIS